MNKEKTKNTLAERHALKRLDKVEENQRKALNTCVEGIMVGNYLTTIGKAPEEDIKTMQQFIF